MPRAYHLKSAFLRYKLPITHVIPGALKVPQDNGYLFYECHSIQPHHTWQGYHLKPETRGVRNIMHKTPGAFLQQKT